VKPPAASITTSGVTREPVRQSTAVCGPGAAISTTAHTISWVYKPDHHRADQGARHVRIRTVAHTGSPSESIPVGPSIRMEITAVAVELESAGAIEATVDALEAPLDDPGAHEGGSPEPFQDVGFGRYGVLRALVE
jgi:hypothetical protein